MKRKAKIGLLVILLLLLLLFAGYFLLAFYYRDGFCLNTWINGVYCTGKSVEEVNEELLSCMEAPVVVVTDGNGENFSLDLGQMEYQGDYIVNLQHYMEEQNSLLWVDNIPFHRNHKLTPSITYNEEMLWEAFKEAEAIKQESGRVEEYILARNGKDGYFLYDGLSDRIDVSKAFLVLKESIDEGEYNLDLGTADCYYDIPMTEEAKKTKILWQKIRAFQECSLEYDMGDCRVPLKAADMSGFLKAEDGIPITDESGSLVLDEEGIDSFVTSLAEEYDTYGKERHFQSTRGDLVTVKGGTYGTKLNQKAERIFLREYLEKHLSSGEAQTDNETDNLHVPTYEKETGIRGKDDIGETYIEIDLTEQKMYYYEAGELKLETEVVTGNTKRKTATPEGVNFVYNKQKNRVLRGPGYASPVKFWVPVNGNIGIHDASWRQKYGGTIYQTNGSHGCINTPADKMAELYDMVEIGTPVVIFQ